MEMSSCLAHSLAPNLDPGALVPPGVLHGAATAAAAAWLVDGIVFRVQLRGANRLDLPEEEIRRARGEDLRRVRHIRAGASIGLAWFLLLALAAAAPKTALSDFIAPVPASLRPWLGGVLCGVLAALHSLAPKAILALPSKLSELPSAAGLFGRLLRRLQGYAGQRIENAVREAENALMGKTYETCAPGVVAELLDARVRDLNEAGRERFARAKKQANVENEREINDFSKLDLLCALDGYLPTVLRLAQESRRRWVSLLPIPAETFSATTFQLTFPQAVVNKVWEVELREASESRWHDAFAARSPVPHRWNVLQPYDKLARLVDLEGQLGALRLLVHGLFAHASQLEKTIGAVADRDAGAAALVDSCRAEHDGRFGSLGRWSGCDRRVQARQPPPRRLRFNDSR